MQYIKNLVNSSPDSLITLEGKLIDTIFFTQNQMNITSITLEIQNELFIIYAFIGLNSLNLQIGFKYTISGIQIGTINTKFCGILTKYSKIYCQQSNISQLDKLKQFLKKNHKLEIETNDSIINPFQINLLQYFQIDEFRNNGILVTKLNNKLSNLKISTLIGYVYNYQQTSKNIVSLNCFEELTYTPFLVDLQFSDEPQQLKIGNKISFQNLQKQNRALLNQFKGFWQDQTIINFDKLKITPKEDIYNLLQKYNVFNKLSYSQLFDIKPYYIDRLLRKFKVDVVKTLFVGFQYTCNNCNGQIKYIYQLNLCEQCQTTFNNIDNLWEITALIYVKIGLELALIKLKDNLVLDFFNISVLYLENIKKYSLEPNSVNVIREENQRNKYLKYFYEQFYNQFISKEILALPYCDFLKTTKVKSKWKSITKLKKEKFEDLKLGQYEQNYDYREFIQLNQNEQLIVYPNGSYEIEIQDQQYDQWFQNRELKTINCFECLGVKDVDQNYFQYLSQIIMNKI